MTAVQRHAFLIMAHTNTEQVQLLLDLLDHPLNDIYLVPDAKGDLAPTALRTANSTLQTLTPRVINWAGWSQVQAELDLLAAAVPGRYHYHHLLTGADLPLVSPAVMHARLRDRRDEFIQIDHDRTADAHYKASYYHPFADSRHYRASRALRGLRFGVAGLQQLAHRPRASAVGVQFRHGSAYFTITHELASHIVSCRPWLSDTFNCTLACDEVFVQTLVVRSQLAERLASDRPGVPANLRLIDWTRRVGNSPHTYTESDLELLQHASETALFARKFDQRAHPEIVAAIAAWVRRLG